MKPVNQEVLCDTKDGQYADHQRAVIASLLHLPISEVPNFNQIAEGDPERIVEEIQKFLKPLGYAWLIMPAGKQLKLQGSDATVYHEIIGPVPRSDKLHAVVGKNGRIVHDPHPSEQGLSGKPSKWQYSYLVKASP